jgi:hypothetical protein
VNPNLKKGTGDESALEEELRRMEAVPLSFRLVLPVILLAVLMTGEQFLPGIWPSLGMPVNFLLAALSALFTGRRLNFLEASREAVNDAIPVLGILMGVGMFIQIMTLVGVQGFIVVSVLALPAWLMYLGMATSIPLFGAVSAFGAASVLGVPFLLALSDRMKSWSARRSAFLRASGTSCLPRHWQAFSPPRSSARKTISECSGTASFLRWSPQRGPSW